MPTLPDPKDALIRDMGLNLVSKRFNQLLYITGIIEELSLNCDLVFDLLWRKV